MGANPKPLVLKILTGNAGNKDLSQQIVVPSTSQFDPPAHMLEHEIASNEWRRMMGIIRPIGMISDVDLAIFEAYCICYEKWMIKRLPGNLRDMIVCIKELGFSPVSRAKIKRDLPNEKDELERALTFNSKAV